MESDRPDQAPALDAARQRRLSLRGAMLNLEHALAAPAVGRLAEWTPAVRAAVTDLQDCMGAHVPGTEGPGGFHSEMLAAAPRLSHQVVVSVREHRRIEKLSDELLGLLDGPANDARAESVRGRGTELIGVLARHRQRGADMIFEAYESDLGGED